MPDAPAQSSTKTKSAPVAFPENKLPGAIEAALLTSDRPLTLARLAHIVGLGDDPNSTTTIRGIVESLNSVYDADPRSSFRIEQVAGGYRTVARAEFAPVLASLHGLKESQSLSRAAVETLAIIAYREPITRADLEAIRGVACGEVLRSLLDKKLIDIVGRAEELGRPMLYGTTKRFLETFGLASIKDLPNHQDFAPSSQPAPATKPRRTTETEPSTSTENP